MKPSGECFHFNDDAVVLLWVVKSRHGFSLYFMGRLNGEEMTEGGG